MIEVFSIDVNRSIIKTIEDDYKNDKFQGHIRLRARLSETNENKNTKT